MTKIRFTLTLMLAFLLPLVIQAGLTPQKTSQRLSLSIHVTDSKGAVIPSAAVWLRGRPGTAIRVAITDEEGACVFSELANEAYVVFAAFPGFKTKEIKETRVSGQTSLNVILET